MTVSADVAEQGHAALEVVRAVLEARVVSASLYGSAVDGGLRPDSDLDVFVVTDSRLAPDEKRDVVAGLIPISSREARPPSWRPIELTVVALPEVRPWRYPPRIELQYGEWLRETFATGVAEPWRNPNPDLAMLIAMARANSQTLIGGPISELLDPVPREDLVRAMVDEIPGLLEDLETDTRNVLLTFARMWTTIATGRFHSKDAAADWVLVRLPPAHRPVLARARDLYRSGGYGDWSDGIDVVHAHAEVVVAEIRRVAELHPHGKSEVIGR